MLMTDYKKRKKQYKYQNENKKNTSSTNNTTQKNTSSSTRQSSTRQSSTRQTPNHSIARLDVVKNDLARVGEKMKAERESQNGTTLRSHYIANKNNLALPAYNASQSFANAKKQEEEQKRKQENMRLSRMDNSTLERLGHDSYAVEKEREAEERKQLKLTSLAAAKGKQERARKQYNGEQNYYDANYAPDKINEEALSDLKNPKPLEYKTYKELINEPKTNSGIIKDKAINDYNSATNRLPEKYISLIKNNPDFDNFVLTDKTWRKELSGQDVTDTEKAIYGYIKKTLGDSAAGKFHSDYIFQAQQARKAEKRSKEMNPFMKAGQAFVSGMDNAAQSINATLLGNTGYNELVRNPTFDELLYSENVENANKFGELGLNALRSTGEMLPSIAASIVTTGAAQNIGVPAANTATLGKAAAGAVTFNNAYQNTLQEAVRKGKSINEARAKSALTGASEATTEYLLGGIKGLSRGSGIVTKLAGMPQAQKAAQAISSATKNLVKNENVRIALKGIGRGLASAGDEALEEYLQEAVISPMIDSYTSGNPLKLNLTSPEAIEAAAIGFITAGILNAPTDVSNTVSDVRNNILEQKGRAMQAANDYITNPRTLSRPSYTPVLSENSLNTIRTNVENGMNEYNEGAKEKKRVSMPEHGIFAQRGVTEQTTPQINTQAEQTIPENQSLSTEQNRAVLDGLSTNDLNVINNLSPEARQAVLDGRVTNKVLDEMTDAAYTSIQYNPELNKKYPATKSGGRQYARDIVANVNDLKSVPMSQIMANNMNPDNAKIYPNKTTKYSDDLNPANFKSEEAKAIIGKNANVQNSTESDNGYTEIRDAIYEQNNTSNEHQKELNGIIEADNGQEIIRYKKPTFREKFGVEAIKNTARSVVNSLKSAAADFKTNFISTGASFENIDRKNDTMLSYRFDETKNARGMADFNITDYQTDINGQKIGTGLNEIFAPFFPKKRNGKPNYSKGLIDSEALQDFTRYVYSKHNVDRHATDTDFLSYKNMMSAEEIAEYEKANPDMVERQQMLVQYYRNLLKNSVDAGLISQSTYNTLVEKYPNYVPTYRGFPENLKNQKRPDIDALANEDVLNLLENDLSSGKKGVLSTSNGIQRATQDSSADLLPLYEQAQYRTYSFIKNQRRNIFTNEVANAKDISDDILSVSPRIKDRNIVSNDVVSFYKNGVLYDMKISDNMKIGFNEIYGQDNRSNLVKGVSKAIELFKKPIVDYNPFFTLTNGVRDLADAIMYSKDLSALIKAYPKALLDMTTNGELWQLYRARGGTEVTYLSKGNRYKKPNVFTRINQLVEQAPRFAEFSATIKKGGKSDANILQALHNAADITVNFGRGGRVTKMLNRTLVPFLNPSVQGLSKTVRTFTDVKQDTGGKTLKAALNLSIKAALLGIAPSLINEMLLKDDDEYKLIDERIKQSYYIFKLPFAGSDTFFFMLPKGRFMSVCGEIGRDSVKFANGDTVNSDEFFENLWNQQGIANPLENNIVSPFTQTLNNKTWYGGDIESQRLIDAYPTNEDNPTGYTMRYDGSTPEWAKTASNALSQVPGLRKLELGPKKIESLVDRYTGIFGDAAISIGKKSNDDAMERAVNAFLDIGKKKFTVDTSEKNTVSGEYYNFKNRYSENAERTGATALDKFSNKFFASNSEEINALKKKYTEANQNDNPKAKEYKQQLDDLMQAQMANAPKYRAAAEKVLKDYPNFDYDSATTKEKELINLKINKEYGGVEYALKQDKTTWEKVQKAKNEHGISYDTSYKVYEYKKTLPSDMKSSDQAKAMEKFFRKQVDNGSMTTGEANAAGDFYINNNQIIPKTNTYDFSSDEAMILSQKSVGGREKYEYTKNVFGNVSIDRYEELLDIYNKGTTKNEKIAYLMRDGKINQYSAEMFHKIHSGSKGFKTTSVTSTLRDNLKVTTAWVENAEENYQSISKSNVKDEQSAKQSYLRQLVKTLPSSLRQQYTDDELYRYLNHYFSQLDYQ